MSEMISIAAFRLQTPFDQFFSAIRSWRKRAKTLQALNSLNGDQLEDIGVSREEIKNLTRKICK